MPEDIKGKVLDAASVVAYAEGSIVSRTVIDCSAGTVTFFAFDAGQSLSEHTAPYDALAHVVDGEAEISIAGEANAVRAGQVILMPANVPHAVRAEQRFKMILTMVRA